MKRSCGIKEKVMNDWKFYILNTFLLLVLVSFTIHALKIVYELGYFLMHLIRIV